MNGEKEKDRAEIFVKHIENHLNEMGIGKEDVICKIKELRELLGMKTSREEIEKINCPDCNEPLTYVSHVFWYCHNCKSFKS